MSTTVVDLLRHGELEGGVRYRGDTEAALTEAGRAQMDAVWDQLCGKVEGIVTSPLLRCAGPSRKWARAAGIPCRVDPDIREMRYGQWEGLSREEIEWQFPGWLARWRENPVGMQIPQAENVEDFSRRIRQGWESMLRHHIGKRTLLVGHSGTLRVILALVLGAPLSTIRRFAMPYASWSRIIRDNSGIYLEFFNRRP